MGVFSETCPHRGASLFFGRNEDNGLRCIYHGWKYDVSGQCVDMPNEPGESNFKDKIRAWAYRGAVHGGVVWAYLGEGDPPGLPDFEWTAMPEEQRNFSLAQRACNWMQGLEGDIDTSHLFFLHGRLDPDGSGNTGAWHNDKHPTLEVVPTKYGVVYGANREENEETTYWRITQFLFPIFTFFPAAPDGTVPGHIWVPMDDHHTMVWTVSWHPTKNVADSRRFGLGNHAPRGRTAPTRVASDASARAPTRRTTTRSTATCNAPRPSPASPRSSCRTRPSPRAWAPSRTAASSTSDARTA